MFSISWSALDAPRSTELTPSFLRHQAGGAARPEVRDTHLLQGYFWGLPWPPLVRSTGCLGGARPAQGSVVLGGGTRGHLAQTAPTCSGTPLLSPLDVGPPMTHSG